MAERVGTARPSPAFGGNVNPPSASVASPLAPSTSEAVARPAEASGEKAWRRWPDGDEPPKSAEKGTRAGGPSGVPNEDADAFFHRTGLPGAAMDVSLIAEATNRRRAAADWISATCNAVVPVASVAEFLAALKSGHVLNDLLVVIAQPHPKPEGVAGFLAYLKAQGLPKPFLFAEDVFDGKDAQRSAAVVADTLLFLRTYHDIVQGMHPDVGDSSSGEVCAVRFRSVDVPCRMPLSRAWDPDSVADLVREGPSSAASRRPAARTHSGMAKSVVDRVCTALHGISEISNAIDKSRLEEDIGPIIREALASASAEFDDRLRASRRHRISVEGKLSDARRELRHRRATGSPGGMSGSQCSTPPCSIGSPNSFVRSPSSSVHPISPSEAMEQEREMQRKLAALEAELESNRATCREKDAAIEALTARCEGLASKVRTLRCEVQDLKGAVRVFARVRPTKAESCIEVMDDSELCMWLPSVGSAQSASKGRESKEQRCRYDVCYGPSSSNMDVANEVVPLALGVLDGYSAAVLAYGQSGSGKTFTMLGQAYTAGGSAGGGGAADQTQDGVIAYALTALFEEIQGREKASAWRYEVAIEIIEIYNDRAMDLLGSQPVDIRSARNTSDLGGAQNAMKRAVRQASDALRAINEGFERRSTGSTDMNAESSRSHLVVTCHVTGHLRAKGDASGAPIKSMHSRLQLCDLAGSERVERSKAEGARFKEACAINKSLSALGTVLHALQAGEGHVPYRNSRLTELLSGSLQKGGCRAVMLIHCAPEVASAFESQSTLQFGTRAARVQLGKAVRLETSGEAKRELNQERERRLMAEQELKQATGRLERGDEKASEVAGLKKALSDEKQKRAQAEALAKLAHVKADRLEEDLAALARRQHSAHASAGRSSLPSPSAGGKENRDYGDRTPRSGGSRIPRPATAGTTARSRAASSQPHTDVSREELTASFGTKVRGALSHGWGRGGGGGGSIPSSPSLNSRRLAASAGTAGWK